MGERLNRSSAFVRPLLLNDPDQGQVMSRYAQHVSTLATPQSEPIPGKPQVQNSAGGYAFALDPWKRLDRFLILGNAGGTYYTGERELTVENAACISQLLDGDAAAVVARILGVSESVRAPKNEPAVFALAMCACHQNPAVRKTALDVMPRVCRTGTDLFAFCSAVFKMRGKGRQLRNAISRWYTEKLPRDLAYQVTKYQQRNGWSHSDVLALCRTKTADPEVRRVLQFARPQWKCELDPTMPETDASRLLGAVEQIKSSPTPLAAASLIRAYKLVREVVPTQFLKSPEVWEALVESMPLGALVRNLGNLSKCGLLAPLSAWEKQISDRLVDQEAVRESRLHPISLLVGLKTYATGHGMRGSGTWNVCNRVVDALNEAFYLAFQNVERSDKNTLLALDVSGSMSSGDIAGCPLTPREGAAAMALVIARTNPNYHILAFSTQFMPLNISPRDSLQDAIQKTANLPFSGTDCAVPMLYALQSKLEVDTFVVITDNETWHGAIHPCQALIEYRRKMQRPEAKLAVVGMTATGFSIADPSDAGMMDFVGFDASTPQILREFSSGSL